MDFDGDALTGNVIVDSNIYKRMHKAHLSTALLDVNSPYSYGGAASLPSVTIQQFANAVTIHPKRKAAQ